MVEPEMVDKQYILEKIADKWSINPKIADKIAEFGCLEAHGGNKNRRWGNAYFFIKK